MWSSRVALVAPRLTASLNKLTSARTPRRYDYHAAQRDEGSAQGYASCLTDTECTRANGMFGIPDAEL